MISNKDGTKTVISYRFNDDNKKVKVTRRIKTTTVREHVNPRVAERRAWAKFGLEKGHAAGPSFDTTSVGENIIFRPSINWKAQAKEAEKEGGEKGSVKDQLKDKKVKCRICSGEHFTARCPFKDTMAPVEEPTGGADMGEDEKAAGGLGAGSSSYVPPHLRKGGAAGGEKMAGRFEKDDLATLRVTNVGFLIFFFVCEDRGLTFSSPSTGQRVGRGTRVAGSLRAVRSCHQSFPCPGQRNPESQGLCFYLLCRSFRCRTRLRQARRLYVSRNPDPFDSTNKTSLLQSVTATSFSASSLPSVLPRLVSFCLLRHLWLVLFSFQAGLSLAEVFSFVGYD